MRGGKEGGRDSKVEEFPGKTLSYLRKEKTKTLCSAP